MQLQNTWLSLCSLSHLKHCREAAEPPSFPPAENNVSLGCCVIHRRCVLPPVCVGTTLTILRRVPSKPRTVRNIAGIIMAPAKTYMHHINTRSDANRSLASFSFSSGDSWVAWQECADRCLPLQRHWVNSCRKRGKRTTQWMQGQKDEWIREWINATSPILFPCTLSAARYSSVNCCSLKMNSHSSRVFSSLSVLAKQEDCSKALAHTLSPNDWRLK